jgi:N-acetylmuramoyl-L-alanine amidase
MLKIINHTNIKLYFLRIFIPIVLLFLFKNIVCCQEDTVKNYKIHTVVIDPGHGGKDSGAQGKYSYEKDVVLAIGLKLGEYIEQNIPEVNVIYTRKTDEFIPLYRRAEIANEANADLFISIHANGSSSQNAKGTETLVLGLHRSEENFEVAKRENSVILLEEDYTTRYENFDPNSPESYIIFSLMQNIYDHQSIGFAGNVQDQFRERVHRQDRGIKRLGLLVLAQTSMPGVLVETSFITNPDEEKYLNSKEGQEYLASAIFRAFRDYKDDIESKSTALLAIENSAGTADSTYQNQRVSETVESPLNTELYYKVQISASSKSIPLNDAVFNHFKDVEEFKHNNIYKYAVGTKTNYNDILEYSKQIKAEYPDAFIIAVRNGEIIPVSEALKQTNLN